MQVKQFMTILIILAAAVSNAEALRLKKIGGKTWLVANACISIDPDTFTSRHSSNA